MNSIKNASFLLLAGCCLMACSGTAQNVQDKVIGYAVDSSINVTVDKMKMAMKDMALLDSKWLENGKEIDMPFLTGNKIPCYGMIFNKKDTISVILSPMMSPGNGVIMINFYNDTATVFLVNAPRDGEKRFKHLLTDSVYQRSIQVSPVACKIFVAEKPQKGKRITGYIEFESKPFYQKENINETYQTKGFFRTALIAE